MNGAAAPTAQQVLQRQQLLNSILNASKTNTLPAFLLSNPQWIPLTQANLKTFGITHSSLLDLLPTYPGVKPADYVTFLFPPGLIGEAALAHLRKICPTSKSLRFAVQVHKEMPLGPERYRMLEIVAREVVAAEKKQSIQQNAPPQQNAAPQPASSQQIIEHAQRVLFQHDSQITRLATLIQDPTKPESAKQVYRQQLAQAQQRRNAVAENVRQLGNQNPGLLARRGSAGIPAAQQTLPNNPAAPSPLPSQPLRPVQPAYPTQDISAVPGTYGSLPSIFRTVPSTSAPLVCDSVEPSIPSRPTLNYLASVIGESTVQKPPFKQEDVCRLLEKERDVDDVKPKQISELFEANKEGSKMSPNRRVEDLILSIADEFIDSITRFSCQLAKHRQSNRLEVKDLALLLDHYYHLRFPGFPTEGATPRNPTASYQARLDAIRD